MLFEEFERSFNQLFDKILFRGDRNRLVGLSRTVGVLVVFEPLVHTETLERRFKLSLKTLSNKVTPVLRRFNVQSLSTSNYAIMRLL